MKKIVSFIFILSVLTITFFSIDIKGLELRSEEAIIAEIRQEQNISNTEEIDVSKVSLTHLEELGVVIMGNFNGGNIEYQGLVNTTKRPDTFTTSNIHIRAGYNFLVGLPLTMMNLTGSSYMLTYGGMMGSNGYLTQTGFYPNRFGMMGGNYWIWMILGLILVLFLLAIGVYSFIQMIKKKEPTTNNRSLFILKERYARGEITKEEYNRLYDELK